MTKIYLGAAPGQARDGGEYERGAVQATAAAPQVRPLRILFSYHYYRDEDMASRIQVVLKDVPTDVFADSGAYSAWTLGQTIEVPAYADWLARWGHLFTCAATLDVIGDPVGSFKQTEQLRKMVDPRLEIVPVFHSNDPGGLAWLQRYIDAGYTYIGISPTGAIYGNPKLMKAWLTQCFRAKPPHVRYHGFGVTGWDTLKSFPWYSVDSSSWASGFRYATLSLFDPKRGNWRRFSMRKRAELLANLDILERYGLTAAETRADAYDRVAICAACVRSWQLAEEWLEEHHGTAQRLYLGTVPNAPNGAENIAKACERLEALGQPKIYLGAGRHNAQTGPANIAEAMKRKLP